MQSLRKELGNLKLNENELVEEFSIRLMKLKNQMRIHEEEIPDRKNIEKVLISLPEKFDAIAVVVVEETKDLSKLIIQ
jgi:phosphopantetheine adenylyltransferase